MEKNGTTTHVLVHVTWDIGDVEISVTLIGEFLKLRVEGFLKVISYVQIKE